jgi:UDP-glucose 4-epimerase
MQAEAVWVVGAGGLLGSALVRALPPPARLHRPARPLAWADAPALAAQFAQEAQAFADSAAHAPRWTVLWAAGVGAMSSAPEVLGLELAALSALLAALAAQPALRGRPGRVMLASSAGALYAQTRADCVSEHTPLAANTAYAAHKLAQEALLREALASQPGWAGLIARYSTLYGPGQARGKAQGLISQVARRIVANQVIHIYVPLDTLRDYLFSDDAAERTLATLADCPAGATTLKIIATEHSTSIAQLIGIFRRVSRRPVRLVTSVNQLSPLYLRAIRFRSVEPAGSPHASGRSLHIGIHQVLEAERQAAFQSPTP